MLSAVGGIVVLLTLFGFAVAVAIDEKLIAYGIQKAAGVISRCSAVNRTCFVSLLFALPSPLRVSARALVGLIFFYLPRYPVHRDNI